MGATNIIQAVVKPGSNYTVTRSVMKEHRGQILQISGLELPDVYEIDFSNDRHHGSSITMIGNADGVLIPTQLIATGKDVYAFYYYVGNSFGQTEHIFRIPNGFRPDRTNEQPTPEEQSAIDQAIEALNDAVERVEHGDYSTLENKPKIESVELTGNKSFDDLGLSNISNMRLEELLTL